MPLAFPLINGVTYDFSSVEIAIAGERIQGFRSISYSHGLDPGEVRGNRAMLIGRTRGTYAPEGSIEMFLPEYHRLISALSARGNGAGYMEVNFEIIVAYSEIGQTPITDQLIGCRLRNASKDHGEGGDALVVGCDLHIMQIIENGLTPISAAQFAR